ncbi:hypothetical protein Tcan_18867 [Toxocara canis]|uniref:Uncharacterized protein n=1 Tax=Toxocara canis TaxID=6265 RepID=A0A0B2VN21_TOXCA|nr:hypothetical protein Tcan_18867 [Toxocara canis]
MFMTPVNHDLVAHSSEVPCPWTPPKTTSKNETLDILSDNYVAMVAFTAAISPDTEIEMMNLALDRAENMEMLTPAKKPNHNYMSAVEEFLLEIGADVETGARKLEEEIAQK